MSSTASLENHDDDIAKDKLPVPCDFGQKRELLHIPYSRLFMVPWSDLPLKWQNATGSKDPTTSIAATIPALGVSPTLVNMSGNLEYISNVLCTEVRVEFYQKGPMKPQVCLTKVMKTPILPASSG